MAIRLKCAHCRRPVAVTRRAAGTQVPCPVCGQSIEVPASSTAICVAERPLVSAPVVAPAPVELEPPPAEAAINYKAVGIAASASIACLAILTLVAGAASRRSAHREWAATEASGRPAPEMVLAHLNRPLFDEPIGPVEEAAATDFVASAFPLTDEMKYEAPGPLVIERRSQFDDEELRKQLLKVPELSLYKPGFQKISFKETNDRLRSLPLHEVIDVVANRNDLAGLPMISSPDCQLGKEPADRLQAISTDLRTKMAQGIFTAAGRRGGTVSPGDAAEPVAEVLRQQRRYIKFGEKMKETDYREASIPAVMQMLCVESRLVRQLVVEHLSHIGEKQSSKALAKLAIFDLSAKVRADALQVLSERPRAEYRQVLLDGLRYPWAPVADHAAEALVVLEDTDAVPALKELAKLPDPAAPFYDAKQKRHVVREVVRINHLGNCMLCHAPSKATTDLVRGRIATPGEVLPPPVQYYTQPGGDFVRADITYLKQDFSVVQPVDNSGAWPTMQRFDYLVRNRPLTNEQFAELSRQTISNYPQRAAAEHALRQLSNLPAKPVPNGDVTLEVTRR